MNALERLKDDLAAASEGSLAVVKPDDLRAAVAVVEAALAFADKLDACQPHIDNAFKHMFIRGVTYTGPQYGEEQTALRAALHPFSGGQST